MGWPGRCNNVSQAAARRPVRCRGPSTRRWLAELHGFEHEHVPALAPSFGERALDLIHRLTPLSPNDGQSLAGWTKVPMLIVRSTAVCVAEGLSELRRQEPNGWCRSVACNGAAVLSLHLPPLAGVIAGSRHTATELPSYYRGNATTAGERRDPVRFPPSPRPGRNRGDAFASSAVGAWCRTGHGHGPGSMGPFAALKQWRAVARRRRSAAAPCRMRSAGWAGRALRSHAGLDERRKFGGKNSAARGICVSEPARVGGGVALEAWRRACRRSS